MSSKEEFEIIRQIAWDAVGTNIETADKALVKIHEYAKEQAARSQGGEAVPKVCDGKEQEAFERYAARRGYDMTEHPLHYLFLSDRTSTARDAWKAAISYCYGISATPQPDKWKKITPAMIEAGAQRLVRWDENSTWPDSWSALDVAAARQDAERVLRSALSVAKGADDYE